MNANFLAVVLLFLYFWGCRLAAASQEMHECVWVDWEKTEAQKKKEQMLLEELVSIVNKRDELVQQRDYEEKRSVVHSSSSIN